MRRRNSQTDHLAGHMSDEFRRWNDGTTFLIETGRRIYGPVLDLMVGVGGVDLRVGLPGCGGGVA